MGKQTSHLQLASLAGTLRWLLVGASLLLGGGAALAAPRPNFVFVLVDDMDYDALQWMPLTRQLVGDAGATFTRNYVEVALCAPSRATFLTGLYAHNHRVLTVDNSNGGFRQFRNRGHEKQNIAVWLRNAGYSTGLIGKYLNGYPDNQPETYVPPGWTTWAVAVQRGDKPYQQFNYRLNENGKLVSYWNSPGSYGTDVYARKSVAFIQTAARANKPFFLFLSLFAPHAPAVAAPRHAGLFADGAVPRTPNFAEEDVSDKPLFLSSPALDEAGVAALDAEHAQRLRSLQAVDEAVKTIHDTLAGLGQLDDTYLIFTSDNGYHLGQHRLGPGKQTAYEEDIHLPFLVRGPGVPAGRTDAEHLIGNADLAPTLAALAGIRPPVALDGRSLAPLLGGSPPAIWRRALPLARWRIPNVADPWPEFRGARTDQYTWVEWADGSRELYDDLADPYQLANLAYDPGLADLRNTLAGLTAGLAACRGAACQTAEDQVASQRR